MMVLVIAMTVLVLPASAATPQEEVEPYAAVGPCKNCGGINYNSLGLVTKTSTTTVSTCNNHHGTHQHTITTTYYRYICTDCGFEKQLNKTVTTTCPYSESI